MATENKPLLRKLFLSNFGVYENDTVFFEPGVNLITGRNGAGKSLLLDALRLVFGLNARSVRMDKISDYIRDNSKNAYIGVELNNPLVDGKRILITNDHDFNGKYLDNDIITIRRKISIKGGMTYEILLPNKKWESLKGEPKNLLLMAFKNIGIDPRDKLLFVTGEDFNSIIDDNPHKRFESLVKKLNIEKLKEKYEETSNKLERVTIEQKDFVQKINSREQSLDEKKRRAQRYQKMITLQKELDSLAIEKKWSDVKLLREKIKNISSTIDAKDSIISNLNAKIEKLIANKKSLEKEYSKQVKELDRVSNELEPAKNDLISKKTEKKLLIDDNKSKGKEIENYQRKIVSLKHEDEELSRRIEKLREEKPDQKRKNLLEEIDKVQKEIAEIKTKKEKLEDGLRQISIEKNREIRKVERELNEKKQAKRVEITRKIDKEITAIRENRQKLLEDNRKELAELKAEKENTLREKITENLELRKRELLSSYELKKEELKTTIDQLRNDLQTLEERRKTISDEIAKQKMDNKRYRPYPGYIEDFYNEVKKSAYADLIVGPVGSFIEIPQSEEKWIDAVTAAIGPRSLAFITTDANAFKEMERIKRRSRDRYSKVRIVKKFEKGYDLPRSEEYQRPVYDHILNIIKVKEKDIDKEDLILGYLSEFLRNTLLVDTTGNIPQQASEKYRGSTFFKLNGDSYKVGRRIIEEGSIRTRRSMPLVGTPIRYELSPGAEPPELKRINEKITKIISEIRKKERKLSELEDILTAINNDQQIKELNRQLKDLSKAVLNIPEVKELQLKVKKLESWLVNSEKDPQLLELMKKRQNIDNIVEQDTEIIKLEKKLQSMIKQEDADEKFNKLSKELEVVIKDKTELEKQFVTLKEDLKRQETSESIKELEKRLDKVVKKITEYEEAIKATESAISVNNVKINNIENELNKTTEKVRVIESKYSKIIPTVKELEKQIAKIEQQISEKERELANEFSLLTESKNKLKERKKELTRLINEYTKNYGPEPADIRPKSKIEQDIAASKRLLADYRSDNLTEKDLREYKRLKDEIANLQKEISVREEVVLSLRNELAEWRQEIKTTFDEKINSLDYVFNSILNSVGATARIEIRNPEDFSLGEVYFWTKFGKEEERELRQHSSGQRQIGLVALTIALLSLSSSPITAIDEFDKGMDIVNKSNLISIIPTMVQTASNLSHTNKLNGIDDQLLAILPEVEKDSIPDEINYIHIVKQGDESLIKV